MTITYRVCRAICWTIGKVFFRHRVVNPENLIEEGPVIFAVNHQSYLDPPMAGICCKRELHFLARKSLLKWPILGPLLPKLNVVPVDQDRADMSALKTLIKLLKAGHRTIIFPEGSRTPDGNFLPAQPGLGLVVAKARVPVIPMRIFGAYEALPRGGKRLRFHPITVVVGRKMEFSDEDLKGDPRVVYQQISDRVMDAIKKLELPTDRN